MRDFGLDTRALDRYLTREPPEPPEYELLRCASCGRFLSTEADATREFVTLHRCDGEAHVIEQTHDEAVLAIIGEEHRGETYTMAYPPACGGKTASHEQQGSDAFEIKPDEAEEYRHAPHFFADPWGGYQAAVRVCVCGCANEDPL